MGKIEKNYPWVYDVRRTPYNTGRTPYGQDVLHLTPQNVWRSDKRSEYRTVLRINFGRYCTVLYSIFGKINFVEEVV